MGVAVRRACGVKVALVYNIGEYRNCSAIVSHFLLLYYGINLTEKESSKHVPLLTMTFFFLCTTVFFFHKGTALSSCQRLVVKNAEVQRPGQSLKQLLKKKRGQGLSRKNTYNDHPGVLPIKSLNYFLCMRSCLCAWIYLCIPMHV